MFDNNIFKDAYLHIISQEMKSDKECQDAPIDDLTKQNIVTIEEEGDSEDSTQKQQTTSETEVQVTSEEPEQNNIQNQESNDQNLQQDFDNEDRDGWGQQIEQKLSDIMSDLDSFVYEIKNCVKGSYTGAKTKEQLSAYMHELADRLNQEAESL